MGSTLCTATRYFKKGFLGGYGLSKAKPLKITSDYGYRKNPNDPSQQQMHYGIDFGVPSGTPISAPVDGRIVEVKVQKNLAGLYAVEEYTNEGGEKFYIYFMHLSSCEFYNKPDKMLPYPIKEGELIGQTGGVKGTEYAGCSTGPHLHLEIRRGSESLRASTAIDPKYFFLAKQFMRYGNTPKFFDNEMFIENAIGVADNYFCAEDIEEHYPIRTVNVANIPEETIITETEVEKKKEKKKPSQDATERLALGIWQITKLLMDGDVQNKQVCDSSISLQTGSLINYFNKVCQKPFVEFFGDTFGNQFYWIVRRPPFDEIGFTRMFNYLVDISEEDILSKNLQWENSEIYSWYQYLPTGDVLGISEQSFMSPAIFFPEYASIWGSRPLSVQSMYFNFIYSGLYNVELEDRMANQNRIAQNMLKDFRFLVESNAYKPFSRKGSITLQGNQSLKRGMMCHLSSGEIFHIDFVSHSYSITTGGVNRTTTIQVSHGIFDHLLHSNDKTKPSYFNIIDFGDYKIENVTFENYREIISKWKVNANTFNFFLSKGQWRYS